MKSSLVKYDTLGESYPIRSFIKMRTNGISHLFPRTATVELSLKQKRSRSQIIINWLRGRGQQPPAFAASISKYRIDLFTFKATNIMLFGGLKAKARPGWLEFEAKDNQKLVHVYEEDQTTLLNTFVLAENDQILNKPLSLNRSPKQIIIARNRSIRSWLKGIGPLPASYDLELEPNTRQISLAGKYLYLGDSPGTGKSLFRLVFEDNNNKKLVHVHDVSDNTLIKSFYLAKEGQILEQIETITKSPIQISMDRTASLIDWLTGAADPPQAYFTKTSNEGRVRLYSYDNIVVSLTGNLTRKRQSVWLTFTTKGENRLVNVFEQDQVTKLNSFYLLKDGEILLKPEPLVLSPQLAAKERSAAILDWWTGTGSLPDDQAHTISSVGRVDLVTLEGQKRDLIGGLKSRQRDCLLTFEASGADKIIHVYEQDGETLLNSFFLVKDGKILFDPQPVTLSRRQISRARNKVIRNWWTANGPEPEPFAAAITRGSIELINLNKKAELLRGQLGNDRPVWLTFTTEEKNKIIRVYESDRTTLINSYFLIKDGEMLENPEAANKSERQISLERIKVVVAWWTGDAPLPEPYPANLSDGKTALAKIGPKQRILRGLGRKKRPVWIVFAEAGTNKFAHVYETDQATKIGSFYLVKDGQVILDPMPVPVTTETAAETIAETEPETTVSARSPSLSPRQRLRYGIGRGDYDSIAAEYHELLLGMAPYWAVHARNSLLLDLKQRGDIDAFTRELSLGAGTSTSFIAWKNLGQVMRIIDLDQSRGMLKQGENPHKIRSSMSQSLPFAAGSFDLITIDSAFRYVPEGSRFTLLAEIKRALTDQGILSITELGYEFDREFTQALQNFLGFRVLTPANYNMELDQDFERDFSRLFPPRVAQTIKDYLKKCGTLIAVRGLEPTPVAREIPHFKLQSLALPNTGNGPGQGIINGDNGFNLGDFEQLQRLQLRISGPKTVNPIRTPQQKAIAQRVERSLSTRVKTAEARRQIVEIILEHSPSGSLLQIGRDPAKLAHFNAAISQLGYSLEYDRRQSSASLTQK
ncbi:MAG: methyltransferase domain-containing protein [Candidatus Saganbacteria bacterium]|nr:methyltransferase domain-containing protein [Candidatus Saganbacteria bacterium]